MRVGDDFYLATSSFEYFPAVPLFHSRDLVNWRQIGHALDRQSQLNLSGRRSSEGIFAPTLRYHDGLFYLITTDVGAGGIGNFYVTASDPAGPWSDPIRVPYGNIDPSLLFDDDGKVYVTAQNGWAYESHIIQYEIDPQTGEALSDPVVIWQGDEGPWTEGPHLYKIDGTYFLLAASGGTAAQHRAIIARASSPYGPFEPRHTPILTHNGLPDHPVQNTGHAELVQDARGDWWALFLAVRPCEAQRGSVLGRETFLAPVHWQDGWPVIDQNEGTVGLRMTTERAIALTAVEPSNTLDLFNMERLSPCWSFLRTRDPASFSLTARPGWLRLYGNKYTLSDVAPAVFVGQRQSHRLFRVETLMEFPVIREGEEAGLAVRYDEKAHCEIGLRGENGSQVLVVSVTKAGRSKVVYRMEEVRSTIFLSVRGEESVYELAYSINGQHWTPVGYASAAAFAPERNGGFTGVLVGLYATGNGRSSLMPADFRMFQYEGVSSE